MASSTTTRKPARQALENRATGDDPTGADRKPHYSNAVVPTPV